MTGQRRAGRSTCSSPRSRCPSTPAPTSRPRSATACRAGRAVLERGGRGVGTSARTRSGPVGDADRRSACAAVPASSRRRGHRARRARRGGGRPARRCYDTAPRRLRRSRRSSRPRSTIEFLLRRGETEMSAQHACVRWRPGGMYDLVGGGFCALLGRRALAGAALREDALRQRAARPRLPARLAGHGRAPVPPGLRGDARLGAAGDARARGRLLRGPGRRLRGRGGPVLRLDARAAARGARRRGRRGRGRVLRRQAGRELRGAHDPDPGRATSPPAWRTSAAGSTPRGRSACGPVSTTSA